MKTFEKIFFFFYIIFSEPIHGSSVDFLQNLPFETFIFLRLKNVLEIGNAIVCLYWVKCITCSHYDKTWATRERRDTENTNIWLPTMLTNSRNTMPVQFLSQAALSEAL